MSKNHVDVVIVGAGLSGIGAACHLEQHCPNKTYSILESREAMGGTWDLFRYPGVRSDSDMHTLGYSFKPWKHEKAIADGPAILDYIHETAKEHDIEQHIRYNQRVTKIEWDTASSQWTLTIDEGSKRGKKITCSFIYSCTGYYRYDKGYTPDFPGSDQFKGQIIHPQQWPEDLDYAGKKVVVIGSGATAITVVPSMAKTAAHVTMLQRSPTYVVSRPCRGCLCPAVGQVPSRQNGLPNNKMEKRFSAGPAVSAEPTSPGKSKGYVAQVDPFIPG